MLYQINQSKENLLDQDENIELERFDKNDNIDVK